MAPMISKINFFKSEAIIFLFTVSLGLLVVIQSQNNNSGFVTRSEFSFLDLISSLIIATVVLILVMRNKRFANGFFKTLLILVTFLGAQAVFGSVVSTPWDLMLTVGLFIIVLSFKNIFTHNLAVALAIAGIAGGVGAQLNPFVAVLVLCVLSLYDIVAVYKTKHMVKLAKSMVESGSVFGFLIPGKLRDLATPKEDFKPGDKFMILGSGDVALPLILIASLARFSLLEALIVALFALGGLYITHELFVHQIERKPMAALPPIATMSIIGYLVINLFA